MKVVLRGRGSYTLYAATERPMAGRWCGDPSAGRVSLGVVACAPVLLFNPARGIPIRVNRGGNGFE